MTFFQSTRPAGVILWLSSPRAEVTCRGGIFAAVPRLHETRVLGTGIGAPTCPRTKRGRALPLVDVHGRLTERGIKLPLHSLIAAPRASFPFPLPHSTPQPAKH